MLFCDWQPTFPRPIRIPFFPSFHLLYHKTNHFLPNVQREQRGAIAHPLDLIAHDYGANISCNIVRTRPSVDGESLPSRRTKRSRSTVRIWSITT